MENMKNSISKEVVNKSDKNPRQLRRCTCIELVREAEDFFGVTTPAPCKGEVSAVEMCSLLTRSEVPIPIDGFGGRPRCFIRILRFPSAPRLCYFFVIT